MGGALAAGLMGLAVLASLPDQGQSAPVDNGQATELEDIVVQGRRIDERVRGFIDEVVAAPAGR